MCWAERLENTNIQIADKDIKVYKVVYKANKKSCKSCVRGFMYEANTLYKMPFIELEKSYIHRMYSVISMIYIQEAYHSYTKIQYTLSGIYKKDSIYTGKRIIFGNQLREIILYNPYYVATFVIPKGATYIINTKGEIVSNKIIYTGRYLKL